MAKIKTAVALEIPVFYGNVNIGDATARLGVSIDRRRMSLAQADKFLCGRRLTGTILARSSGGAEQQSLPGADDDTTIEGTFDAKSFSVKRKSILAGLTFSLADISVSDLGRFAQREGVLTIAEFADLPDKELASAEAEE